MSNGQHLLSISNLEPSDLVSILARTDLNRRAETQGHSTHRAVTLVCWPSYSGTADQSPIKEEDQEILACFEKAAARLGFVSSSIIPHAAESLSDIFQSIEAIVEQCRDEHMDIVVVRHPSAGVANRVAELAGVREAHASVINGGDGSNENPTDAFANVLRMSETFDAIRSSQVVIVGNTATNATARSFLLCLVKLGARVALLGPPGLVPTHLCSPHISIHHSMNSVSVTPDFICHSNPTDYELKSDALMSRDIYTDTFDPSALADRFHLTAQVLDLDSASIRLANDAGKIYASLDDRVAARQAAYEFCSS